MTAMKSTPFLIDTTKPLINNDPPPGKSALAQAMAHVKEFMTDSQKAHTLLREGKIFLDAGDYRGSIECFNEAISIHPFPSLFVSRATSHKMLEMYQEAYFDYCYLIRLEPDSASHFSARGLCLSKMKKLSMAIEDFDTAIQLDPMLAITYYYRALTFAEYGKHASAINDFSHALGDDQIGSTSTNFMPSNDLRLKCLYRRALAHFELKNYTSVVKDLNLIIQMDPNSIPPRALLGRALKILSDHQKAEEQLNFVILMDENQPSLYTERGDIRFRTGQRNKIIEAIYDFDKAVKLLEAKLILSFNRSHSSSETPLQTGASRSNSSRLSVMHRSASIGGGHGNFSRVKFDEGDTESGVGGNSQPNSVRKDSTVKQLSSRAYPGKITSSRGMNLTANNNRYLMDPYGQTTSSQSKELEEQLADTVFKRAQAKLLIESDPMNIQSALTDAKKAIGLVPDDDDYQMAVATCYIRLNQYDDAIKTLSLILQRSPNNYKALYNYSFCERASGHQKVAIEGLTKIIAYSNPEAEFTNWTKPGLSSTNGAYPPSFSIPIHRVYEMRGTLFHEMQAHKLALSDLARAIAINPSRAENYVLRGDCNCKLGNYEQALSDYNLAVDKQYEDLCSLYISRGGVFRLIGDSSKALTDFSTANNLMDPNDKVSRVRISSFEAFCLIDLQDYSQSLELLNECLKLNREVLDAVLLSIHEEISQPNPMPSSENDNKIETNNTMTNNESEVLYLRRIEWIILYHLALCCYMLKRFDEATKILKQTLSDENRKYVVDDISLGALYFFLGQCQFQLKALEESEDSFATCLQTHWIDVNKNKFLCVFALAKLNQVQGLHQKAIDLFNEADKLMKNNAYVYFRRAWSHKALRNYESAGEDFETAKLLKPDDPNFAMNYKTASNYQYMIIESEPDLLEIFPSLLPVPGLNTR